jgi:predicted TIM-barrel fold metal-dependent hydrolase
LFAGHLGAFCSLVEQVPEAWFALDHCAFPDLRSGPPYPEASSLVALADHRSVHLKVTSHVLLDAAAHGGTAALLEHLAASFGADRLCWGSDHPQTVELQYPEMVALAADAVRTLDDAAQRSILDLTARRLFFRSEP